MSVYTTVQEETILPVLLKPGLTVLRHKISEYQIICHDYG